MTAESDHEDLLPASAAEPVFEGCVTSGNCQRSKSL